MRTHTVTGYLMLAFVAEPRAADGAARCATRARAAHREAWLDARRAGVGDRYELGVEVLACRRLVKGYSDTHARGLSKFDRVMAAVPALAGARTARCGWTG